MTDLRKNWPDEKSGRDWSGKIEFPGFAINAPNNPPTSPIFLKLRRFIAELFSGGLARDGRRRAARRSARQLHNRHRAFLDLP
jgi:hypothetical protein